MKKTLLIPALALISFACSGDEASALEKNADKAADAVEEAADDAGDAIEEGAEEVEDALDGH